MGANGLLTHRDPHFLPWRRKEESRGGIVGVTGQGAHTNVYVGPRAQSEEELLLGFTGRGQRERPAIESDTPDHSME